MKNQIQNQNQIYPSGSTTPSVSVAIKAPKDFPACNITSHIGAPQEALASFLNDLMKDYADKNPLNIKNSNDFVKRIKESYETLRKREREREGGRRQGSL